MRTAGPGCFWARQGSEGPPTNPEDCARRHNGREGGSPGTTEVSRGRVSPVVPRAGGTASTQGGFSAAPEPGPGVFYFGVFIDSPCSCSTSVSFYFGGAAVSAVLYRPSVPACVLRRVYSELRLPLPPHGAGWLQPGTLCPGPPSNRLRAFLERAQSCYLAWRVRQGLSRLHSWVTGTRDGRVLCVA